MMQEQKSVVINKTKYSIKKEIKNYSISKINKHNIVCKKVYHDYIPKYKRYIKKTTVLKVYNSTQSEPIIGQKVILGYLGMRLCKTKSHTIIELLNEGVLASNGIDS
jgi:ribosomal protein S17